MTIYEDPDRQTYTKKTMTTN